ncbi:maleylpyruvate isomerase family mycothiol-dependent enzyme [Mycobacterium sp. ITM-2016-00317]|uniref:maleylpyruvate isomerase family mycothiol-dependent enzyme n=1 Tax=Mycobacterium sp. ITM-2016-00317 TaxID=2099694 RepID=UPI000D49F574|nr:maleylpyruvate isomerase family mycothiol-dependent enzyme [Mycobacterium sp. ITM-2016-00317]WNG87095.1 maleylpyruvate isomerase family mycothiol-dependent enzyme [Mycobacterium sp. ITM-2016-00317]
MAAVHSLAFRERERFAELLAGLSAEQWSAPSLCAGWSVRDVAAHAVAYLGQSVPGLTRNMIRARGDVDRVNSRLLRTSTALTPAELVGLMARHTAPAGAAALYGGRVALIECVIHQQDIRRPLGLDRDVPEDALRASLTYARVSPVIGGARRTRGVRLVATDIDWAAGRGPEVRGPGEALLLAMTGRIDAIGAELAGEGVSKLS